MSHFMMDCYFPDVTKPGGLACDSLPIKALNKGDAIETDCDLEEAWKET